MNLKTKITTTLYLVVVLVSGISVSGYMYGSEAYGIIIDNNCGRGGTASGSGGSANGGTSDSGGNEEGNEGASGGSGGSGGSAGAFGTPGSDGTPGTDGNIFTLS